MAEALLPKRIFVDPSRVPPMTLTLLSPFLTQTKVHQNVTLFHALVRKHARRQNKKNKSASEQLGKCDIYRQTAAGKERAAAQYRHHPHHRACGAIVHCIHTGGGGGAAFRTRDRPKKTRAWCPPPSVHTPPWVLNTINIHVPL